MRRTRTSRAPRAVARSPTPMVDRTAAPALAELEAIAPQLATLDPWRFGLEVGAVRTIRSIGDPQKSGD